MAAGTDGVEVDRIVLSQEDITIEGTGPNSVAYQSREIDLSIVSDIQDDRYTLTVSNLDDEHTAINVAWTMEGFNRSSYTNISGLDICQTNSDTLVTTCVLSALAPGASHTITATLAESSETAKISANVLSEIDPDASNNFSVASKDGSEISDESSGELSGEISGGASGGGSLSIAAMLLLFMSLLQRTHFLRRRSVVVG